LDQGGGGGGTNVVVVVGVGGVVVAVVEGVGGVSGGGVEGEGGNGDRGVEVAPPNCGNEQLRGGVVDVISAFRFLEALVSLGVETTCCWCVGVAVATGVAATAA